jgi:hypothetical protein
MYRGPKTKEPAPLTNILAKSDMLVCRLCNLEAEHNNVLRLSYCPVHGFASPLDSRSTMSLQSTRTRISAYSFQSSKNGW